MNDYDLKHPSTFITYLDMNNLYGWAMSEYLPFGGFKWLKNVDEFGVISISEKSLTEYFLKVDLKYLDELHELYNDYPLAPKKRAVCSDMLPNYCKKIADKYEIKVGNVKKLIPNLDSKTNYAVHYRNYQLYLFLGIKLKFIECSNVSSPTEWKNILILTLKKK